MTTADLDQRIAVLETIADWREELQLKICRAILRFEFTGLDVEEQERLEAEVKTFNQICRCLAGAGREAIPQREAA